MSSGAPCNALCAEVFSGRVRGWNRLLYLYFDLYGLKWGRRFGLGSFIFDINKGCAF